MELNTILDRDIVVKELNWKNSFRSKVEAHGSDVGLVRRYLVVDTLFAMERNRKKRTSDIRSSELMLDDEVIYWVRVWVRIGKRVRR
jgi:hypothetical protein